MSCVSSSCQDFLPAEPEGCVPHLPVPWGVTAAPPPSLCLVSIARLQVMGGLPGQDTVAVFRSFEDLVSWNGIHLCSM